MDIFPKTFEEFTTDGGFKILRLRIPGGFLVVVKNTETNAFTTEIVQEPNHKWQGETENS